MIKLVCFDLDGTINDNWDLYPPLREKMNRMRAAGIKTAIITGRELLGSLYYIHNAKFPFDYLGPGGSLVVFNPLSVQSIPELFNPTNIHFIKHPGPSKTDRLVLVKNLAGVQDNELLFIDDHGHAGGQLDLDKFQNIHCHLGAPISNHGESDWAALVRSRGGMVTNSPCGKGTLEILNHYLPNI